LDKYLTIDQNILNIEIHNSQILLSPKERVNTTPRLLSWIHSVRMWMTPLLLSRQNHSSPIWSAQLISSQLYWLPQRCTDQLILGALWQRPLISSKNKKKDRRFWPQFRCYEQPIEQSKQGLFPHQSIHWYSFYLHSYNSNHLQASSVFNIDPCLVPLSPDYGATHLLVTYAAEEKSSN